MTSCLGLEGNDAMASEEGTRKSRVAIELGAESDPKVAIARLIDAL